ncbi:hypothetical protein RHGRI_006312 [Rhododendron griersonianum]|uniref:Uncharacterized protein n=1 Tax=Rhododendron griersonianum TaxID=479676 RepID=A0AAV6KTN3_9ERIC|nr:hypothetical protein RHGRI_006312 [Rhododendron griersonianum]
MLCLLLKANPDTGKEVADSNGVEDGDGAGLASEIRKMPTRGQGRGRRGVTPHGVTARAVLTLAVSSMPSNDLAQNSSPAPHISESAQPNVSLTPVDASVTKNVRGKTKGLALAKIRGRREKVKLGFSRTLRQPTSENDDDLIRFTIEIGLSKFVKGSCIIQQMAEYERERDEQIANNLAILKALGIKYLVASLPALYRISQRKGTRIRKSKVAISNDDEFLPHVGEESFGYSSDDSFGSQADKVKCAAGQKKKGDYANHILRDSQGTREERLIIEGATSTPPTQPSTDHVEGMSVVATQPTQLPCIAANNESKKYIVL